MRTNTAKTKNGPRVFDTDKRIRLGIWGLGRGMSFFIAISTNSGRAWGFMAVVLTE